MPLPGGEKKAWGQCGTLSARNMPLAPVWLTGTNKVWEEALHYATEVSFSAKRMIPAAHEGNKGFYYLKKGNVKGSYSIDEKKMLTMYYMGPGVLLYNIANRSDDSCFHIYSLTKVKCYFFRMDHIFTEHFAISYPKLILNFSLGQAEKTTLCIRRIAFLSGFSTFSHACSLILELWQAKGSPHISQAEMASILGVQRSWLCKILQKLKQEKVIGQCTKSRIEVLDKKQLVAYARQTPAAPVNLK